MLKEQIFELFRSYDSLSRAEIIAVLPNGGSDASVKRALQQLVKEERLIISGAGRTTRYRLSPQGRLLSTINLDTYYSRDIDVRSIISNFNFELLSSVLPGAILFTEEEQKHLQSPCGVSNPHQPAFRCNETQGDDSSRDRFKLEVFSD